MEQTINCKIIMLSRECKTLMKNDLYKITDYVNGDKLFMIDRTTSLCNLWQPQHLYFTSQEEIKEGDWFIANQEARKCTGLKEGDYPYQTINPDGEVIYHSKHWKDKIISCTDSSLSLPSISSQWIKDVYVPSSGSITSVKLEQEYYLDHKFFNRECGMKLKLTVNNEICIVKDKSPAPIPKELDEEIWSDKKQGDWNRLTEKSFNGKRYKLGKDLDALAEEFRRKTTIDNLLIPAWKEVFKAGYTEALKSHPFNDTDMKDFARLAFLTGQGMSEGRFDMNKELEQYKASKTVI